MKNDKKSHNTHKDSCLFGTLEDELRLEDVHFFTDPVYARTHRVRRIEDMSPIETMQNR